ncbi:PREDICTED: two-component response regulator-like APRR9 isoform X2 [Tarenaya hassleriana]|uniref:two-component response regulator-like APRR9 isoform X2 n=1 Tax=Tarenaya hassleriana TaxID=28532 RepID=UPI00053C0F32|nr:PREDICTED: two-component response regulator-like APRR9 isoform X2 [Tarenaya hassleriana]
MVEVVVVSSDDGMEAEEERKEIDGEGPSSKVSRWEKHLPKTVLRVLLVEADDSTRHIITALLRKCSYRVAAVADGLMAWETLKGKPQNIDIVLTELDLPSISGFALLTLVMEHETCKNIPVIMMSSQDSFSMVLKCMLRGAADYLIKPVRKNELRNLWQHVWRRQTLQAGYVHHSLPASQSKLEATAENSTDSRDYLVSTHKNANRKGNDSGSSCSSQFKGDESEYLSNMQGTSRAKQANGSIGLGFPSKLMENAESVKQSAIHLGRREEKLDGPGNGGGNVPLDEGFGFKDLGRHTDNYVGNHSSREEKLEYSNMTIDLIGVFDEQPKCLHGENCSTEQFGPELELSLKRFCPRSSKNQDEIEGQKLCHSNNSAFSRYDNGSSSESKTSTESHGQFRKVSSDMRSITSNQENIESYQSGQYGQAEFSYRNQVPRSIRITHQAKELQDSCFPANTLVGDSDIRKSQEAMSCSGEQERVKTSQELELGCQSTCTNNSCDDSITGQSNSTEKSKEEQLVHVASQDRHRETSNPQHLSQREAALTKFRMKRKDRCFEKKVRYQSRKKLAEQRPRVRGQFVRSVNYEISTPDVSNGA